MKTFSKISIYIYLCMLLTNNIQAGQNYLDCSFGVNKTGIVTNGIGVNVNLYGVVLQADNKIVSVGSSQINDQSNCILTRYTNNGILDTSFGSQGIVTSLFGLSCRATCVAIQADQKIIIAGNVYQDAQSIANRFLIARYNTDGSLDTSFGNAGIVSVLVGDGGIANSIALQTDGKIVIAGVAVILGTPEICLIRCNSNGTIDTSFGNNGIVLTQVGPRSTALAITLQTDNKILIAGYSTLEVVEDCTITRFNTDGSIDTSFGSNGNVIIHFENSQYSHAEKIALQNDSKILFTGTVGGTPNKQFVARITAAGQLDTSFGSNGNGIVIQSMGAGCTGDALSLYSDQTIGVGGTTIVNGESRLFVSRFLANGTLDTSFGDQGMVIASLGMNVDTNAEIVQADDKLIVVGSANTQYMLARFVKNNTAYITIAQPVNNSTITTNQTPINGYSSYGNAQVNILIDGVSWKSVSTSANGNWDAGTSDTLVNGNHTITANLLVNSVQIATITNSFTVTVPDFITMVNPANNGMRAFSSTQSVIQGMSSRKNADVQIFIDDILRTTVQTDKNGQWKAGISSDLVNGDHKIAVSLMINKNIIASAVRDLFIDKPYSVTVTSPIKNVALKSAIKKIKGKTNLANGQIILFVNGVFKSSITADAQGIWHGEIESNLPNGAHYIMANLINPNTGNQLASSFIDFTQAS
jgi:uncharacterized delta-60 repeat protein